ncbi:hypothetical protein T01_11653 [Trichinella spiralis]|uniref:Uncharacterized protein n=1 Tax=Trichinella spiralis TaxID=6334 RepID=A0A0V1BJV6_TRISP|nr:hypothetical protein T01_11653 [Trichinella spiralis]
MLRRFPIIIIKPSLFMTVCLMTTQATMAAFGESWLLGDLFSFPFFNLILSSSSSSVFFVFHFLIIVAVDHWNCKYLS